MTKAEMYECLKTPEGIKTLRKTPEGKAFYESHIPVRIVGGPVIGFTNLEDHLQTDGCSTR